MERLNRFVVLCSLDGRTVRAYLPNPGRLWELLLPGRTVYLSKNPEGKSTDWTAVAVERDGRPVLLHTHLSNAIVGGLLDEHRIPGLEDATILRPEVACGRSRFDFLLEREGKPFLLEVKSCTLFGNKIALFPDAVTARGRRHLEELGALAGQGAACGVVFLVHSARVTHFLPDYHTDLAFARTFLRLRNRILIKAVAVEWNNDLTLGPRVRDLEIPWEVLAGEAQDRGSYLVVLHLAQDRRLDVGALGRLFFRRGFYIYAGSAKANLQKRIDRHRRKTKAFHWHIDYLAAVADQITGLPIRTGADLEHELAAALGRMADRAVPGFGSSDCNCPSHLFALETDPLHTPAFIDLLLRFRIDRLEGCLGKKAHCS